MSAEQLFSLQDKAAIVTGGTGVLGGAIAHGLAAAGARVGVLGRRVQRAAAVAQTIEADGGAALPLVADVLDRAQIEAAREMAVSRPIAVSEQERGLGLARSHTRGCPSSAESEARSRAGVTWYHCSLHLDRSRLDDLTGDRVNADSRDRLYLTEVRDAAHRPDHWGQAREH